jgi:2-polyprenyl-3-methyl-5-hydroxy-6-metoxy-1,4-benzoquinol methylase
MTITSQAYKYSYQDSSRAGSHSYLLSPLLSMLPKPTNADNEKISVLDLGCGNGSLSYAIAKQGYEVVGLEESEEGVTIACQNFSNCHFVQGSIYSLPETLLQNSFDIIISVEVIEHLFYPRELLRNARKCLKPNGRLILTTPYHGYLKNLLLSLSGKMDQHFTVLWDGGHIKFFSVSTLISLLEAEGYTDINFKFAGRLPYFWKSMLCSCSPIQL